MTASVPRPSPPQLAPPLLYEVAHTKVVVRAEPSTSARALATRLKGDIVMAETELNGWARLCDQAGWMLIDGASVGLGKLLHAVASPMHAAQRPVTVLTSGTGSDHVLLRGDVRMPLLGLGTGGVPGLEGEEATRLVVHALCKCGLRLIDTAADYHNEEAVGAAIRKSGVPREDIFVCTKIGPLSQGYDACLASVQRSLQRMKLDYLDCVFIHWPGAWVPEQKQWEPRDWMSGRGVALAREMRAGSWRALEDLKTQGKLRTIGVSNYTPAHLLETLRSCRIPPDVLQSEHHPFFSNAAVRRLCSAHGIAFMAYGPLSGGHAEQEAKQKGVHNATVRKVAAAAGRTPAQVVLRWATQRGVAVLPKSHRVAGVEENAAAHGFDLSDELMAQLDALETGEPLYWDPRCVDQLDHFNIFLDKQRLQAALGGGAPAATPWP